LNPPFDQRDQLMQVFEPRLVLREARIAGQLGLAHCGAQLHPML
jgi:hypothetical protein